MVLDLSVMMSFSQASWDSPPGTGYGTVLVLLVAGLVASSGAVGRRRLPAARSESAPVAAV